MKTTIKYFLFFISIILLAGAVEAETHGVLNVITAVISGLYILYIGAQAFLRGLKR